MLYFLMRKGGGAAPRPCLSSQGRHEPGPRGLRHQGPLWPGLRGEAPPRPKASVARGRHRTRRGCRHEAGRRLWGGMAGRGLLPPHPGALRSCGVKRGRQRRISSGAARAEAWREGEAAEPGGGRGRNVLGGSPRTAPLSAAPSPP